MITAVAHEAVALSKLLQMVSECDEFQVATGTTAPAGALDYIFAPEKRNETEAQQEDQSPAVFAVVNYPENLSSTSLVAGGSSNHFTLSGSMQLQVIRQLTDMPAKDELVTSLNLFGAIRTHLLNYAALDDYLAITSLPFTSLLESDDKHVSGYRVQKPIHKAVFTVEWGPGE